MLTYCCYRHYCYYDDGVDDADADVDADDADADADADAVAGVGADGGGDDGLQQQPTRASRRPTRCAPPTPAGLPTAADRTSWAIVAAEDPVTKY